MQVLVVYASQTGRTERMARAFADGAGEAGAEVVLRRAEDAQPEELLLADAVAVGSGVHMSGMEPAMSKFIESTAPLWLQGRLVGKLAAAFASGGSGARGGGELVLLSLLAPLAEHGCLIVPMHNRLDGFLGGGMHWGPIAWTAPRDGVAGPTEEHLRAAKSHGRYVAECARRWRAGGATEPG